MNVSLSHCLFLLGHMSGIRNRTKEPCCLRSMLEVQVQPSRSISRSSGFSFLLHSGPHKVPSASAGFVNERTNERAADGIALIYHLTGICLPRTPANSGASSLFPHLGGFKIQPFHSPTWLLPPSCLAALPNFSLFCDPKG